MRGEALITGCLLVGLTVFVFAPVQDFGFVNYDDGAYVTENPHVRQGLTESSVRWAISFDSSEPTSNWHPLTWLSLMADVSVFGLNPAAMHVVNLALHVGNVLLLFFILRSATGTGGCSAFVAGVFAIHPLHVESVVWISERKDVLSTLWILLALAAHLKYVSTQKTGWHVAALLLFVCSLMTKQMYVTFPFLLLLVDFWPLRRITENGETESFATVAWRLIWEKKFYFFVTALFCVIAVIGQERGGAIGSLRDFSLQHRIMNAILSYVRYLGKTFWPQDLAVFYPYPQDFSVVLVLLAAGFLMAVSWIAVRLRNRAPAVVTGWFWFLGTLVPVIGLVQIGRQSMADRYMYFPLIGVTIAVAWPVATFAKRFSNGQRGLQISGLAIVIVLAALARHQTGHWKDSLTLFSHAAAVAESPLALTKVGYERAQRGEFDAAANVLHRALRLDPDYVAAHTSLGNTFLAEGRIQEAIRHFETAAKLDPEHAEAHYNLGVIHARMGDQSQAITHYSRALQIQEDNASIHANLGIAYVISQRPQDAKSHLNRALELDPQLIQARMTLARVFADEDKPQQAIDQLLQALKAHPQLIPVHSQLAELYTTVGNDVFAKKHKLKVDELAKHAQSTGDLNVSGQKPDGE